MFLMFGKLNMTAKTKPWTFDAWFKAQHGNRPSRKSLPTLREEAIALEQKFREKREELIATQAWEDKRNTALYAWQIPDSDKKVP
jgi:hypothetical protein